MCWVTLSEVHPIAHKTSCLGYCKCKQFELIIGLYACADLLYTKVIVHFRWDYVTTASSYIAGYLNMLISNVLIHMTEVAKKQEINGCMCWVTLSEVHPSAHKTSCLEYCKCKQFELIIGLYACADLLYTKVIVHYRWDYVTTASSYIAGY